MTLDEMVSRIVAMSGRPSDVSDSARLLHAYCACLTFDEICTAIVLTLVEPADVRLALRGRLMRLVGDAVTENQQQRLVELVEDTWRLSDAERDLKLAVDALQAVLFRHLPTPTQHHILERWVDRGTRAAMVRWLKATRDVPALYDASIALTFWRSTGDARAAKSLAYQAPIDMLGAVLDALLPCCDDSWIIAKAVIRSSCDDGAVWEEVRTRHPATYLYLCAHMRRAISDEEAFELVWRSPASAVNGDRGLAIWAIGQMGKVAVLDQIYNAAPALLAKDIAELRARLPDIETVTAMDELCFEA